MDSFKLHNAIQDDADDEDLYIPSTVDKGKNKAEEMSFLMPSPASVNQHQHDKLDLAYSIKGMYRILDLITERGGGGLVDKIIISQDSVKAFINTVSPGAYVSVTKVDFKALDNYIIKPVGVYGSKEEIVRFLSELGVVDGAINIEQAGNTRQTFLLHWPEEGTWDDSAASSVRRNRETFMRYLMKMCDQVVALISSEHAQTIIWNEDDRDRDRDVVGVDQRESARMFTFEVAQTNEQEESVTVREGFKAASDDIALPADPADGSTNPDPVKPFLLFGETTQGFMTVTRQEAQRVSDEWKERTCYPLQLEKHLGSDCVHVSEGLDDEALGILVRFGLETRFPQECSQWRRDCIAIRDRYATVAASEIDHARAKLDEESPHLRRLLHEAILDEVQRLYPCLDRGSFPYVARPGERTVESPELFPNALALYPKVNDHIVLQLEETFHDGITNKDFQTAKARICFAKELYPHLREKLDNQALDLVVQAALTGESERVKNVMKPNARSLKSKPKAIPSTSTWTSFRMWLFPSYRDAAVVDGLIQDAMGAARQITDSNFLTDLDSDVERHPAFKQSADEVRQRAHGFLGPIIKRLLKKLLLSVQEMKKAECNARINFECASREEEELRKLRSKRPTRPADILDSHTLNISAAEETKRSRGYGTWESKVDAMVIYTVHVMNLTTQDQHELQLNPTTIPSPRFKFSHSFKLRQGHSVIRAQLLDSEKILLVVADRVGNLTVYLEGLAGMDGAIHHGRGKALNREKIGQDFILAYDESKRILGVVSSDKLLLHIFAFDDARGFQASRSAINLISWYNEGTSIRHACFINGTEELLLVDSQAQARVFSLITLQFRPATLNLEQVPFSVSSTPDGSCLLVSHVRGSETAVTAYHWDTFGSTEGITLDISNLPIDNNLIVTSLISRSAVHLLTLDFSARVLPLTTEFMFKEKGHRGLSSQNTTTTAHNCLIDCHSDVWTRFPVLPAVQRETISSSSLRSPKTLVFITDRDFAIFASHFAEMIYTFERSTKKPTGDILKSIKVSAASFSVFSEELCSNRPWNVSQYRVGEWLVDILCLIPIHIAIAKENRFVPLKDGVYSPDLEKSLLGADVSHIVDNLSFGWYESLFQSYMASKPVKVVSSMGEQSVGKSFALNHLVDTSFAGSAMRTTEGVWMSVTPTEEALIVALDFEGRLDLPCAQYRTVCARGRVACFVQHRNLKFGLFQSFQSSSTILDPKANPSLFQSTLVVIIKDVIESDSIDIAKEFSLKFQRIVQDEQEANFISQLHAGKLRIIPWPVIESREFYRLFPAVKGLLDQQVVTHRAAGEFLHMMKTLMAKLKVETMASHRAQLISMLLPNALAFGLAEIDPEREPLKNLDTDSLVELPDTPYQLFIARGGVGQSATAETTLADLRTAWDQYQSRQYAPEEAWIEDLCNHLEGIVSLRIAHVREWLDQNLSRFEAGHASIDELRRNFEDAIVDLKTNVQLCKLQCASCQLLCVQSRLHEGSHHCQTDHFCVHECNFCMELSGEHRQCSMTAGHAGRHICVVTEHLCGKPCKFAGRHGCLDACTKVIDHPDDEHLCAAPMHACGKLYTPAMRSIRQEHLCTATCSAPGICEIETAPQSVEATFTGRNETFQYTKVPTITVSTRAWFTSAKSDAETAATSVLHPLAIPQQEHETRHGSMSRTRWTVDGPDDVALEIEGRKFSTNDEGAPMMCNLVCQAMGRHVHIDYCRADDEATCTGNDEIQHLTKPWLPNPDRAKDALTHNLFWKRSGKTASEASLPHYDLDTRRFQGPVFKGGASKTSLSGPEHSAASGNAALPSYCILPLFHPPLNPSTAPPGKGYISHDGHQFPCRNPVVMQQAFHVSTSMSFSDMRPLANTPATARISARSNNRFGAVLSSLYNFWTARAAAMASPHAAPRDAYSVILFDRTPKTPIVNDFASTPDQLLDILLPFEANLGTNFTKAIQRAQAIMEQNWSAERYPVIIFLSDGECSIADVTMQDLCRTAARLGMAEIARDAQNNAPRDLLTPAAVQLAETFLVIAESLRKPRGALLH
ncbi:hypothetical protein BU15DRAFT_67382 [Melanogaster broomeanus]|nr:hypothetical protein BU15DRAFT_67382 [Melanogaster broomeanus]